MVGEIRDLKEARRECVDGRFGFVFVVVADGRYFAVCGVSPGLWPLGRWGRMRRLPTLPRPLVVQRRSSSLWALSWARMQHAQKAPSVTVVSRMSKVDSVTVPLAVSWLPKGMGKESGR